MTSPCDLYYANKELRREPFPGAICICRAGEPVPYYFIPRVTGFLKSEPHETKIVRRRGRPRKGQ